MSYNLRYLCGSIDKIYIICHILLGNIWLQKQLVSLFVLFVDILYLQYATIHYFVVSVIKIVYNIIYFITNQLRSYGTDHNEPYLNISYIDHDVPVS